MRLKTFTGKNQNEVMARVRKELGSDAIIVKTENKPATGIKLTAAIAELNGVKSGTGKDTEAGSIKKTMSAPITTCDGGELTSLLFAQGLPFDLATRLQSAAMAFEVPDVQSAVTSVFDSWFKFRPAVLREGNNYLLVGPPGSGKTVGAAKLAVACIAQGTAVEVISLDQVKAGAFHQLAIYGKAMGLEIRTISSPGALTARLSAAGEHDPMRIIDSWGVNPYDPSALSDLASYAGIKNLVPILVLPSGLSPDEATATVEKFAGLGVTRVIASKVDCARQHGGLIAALYRGGVALSALGGSPFIGDGYKKATPQSLAQLLKPVPRGQEQSDRKAV